MARDWRRAVLAALGAAMLAGAGVLGAHAQGPAAEEPEEEAQSAAEPKSSGKRKQDPADAQRAVDTAGKHLQAGRAEQAVQTLSVTLTGGNLPPAVMAKAFYVRGTAYRQLGKPAQAISDLTSALWLKGGLGGEERAAATKERTAAYADAGLPEGGEVAAPAKSGSGNWLSSLFGAPASPAPPPARAPAPVASAPPAPPPAPAPSAPKVSSTVERAEAAPAARTPAQAAGAWTSKTQVQPPRPALAAAAPPQPPKAAAPPAARAEPVQPPRPALAAAAPPKPPKAAAPPAARAEPVQPPGLRWPRRRPPSLPRQPRLLRPGLSRRAREPRAAIWCSSVPSGPRQKRRRWRPKPSARTPPCWRPETKG